MQETQIWSLGWEDPLEKGMAAHSSILGWEILWTEEPAGLQSMESQELDLAECALKKQNKGSFKIFWTEWEWKHSLSEFVGSPEPVLGGI